MNLYIVVIKLCIGISSNMPQKPSFPRVFGCHLTLPMLWGRVQSLTKLFNECEVTFTGIKSPNWRDDVSFYPSYEGAPPSASEDRSLSSPGDEANLKSQGGVADRKGAGYERMRPVCSGKFVRNFNRDSGRFTLSAEEDDQDSGDVWVLRLNWDRWDTEVVYLMEEGKLLRFEGA